MKIIKKLHAIKEFRTIAKRFFSGFPIKQSFHTGTIYIDAVEHSWAWTGDRRYETFDIELQDKLYLKTLMT